MIQSYSHLGMSRQVPWRPVGQAGFAGTAGMGIQGLGGSDLELVVPIFPIYWYYIFPIEWEPFGATNRVPNHQIEIVC